MNAGRLLSVTRQTRIIAKSFFSKLASVFTAPKLAFAPIAA